MKKIFRPIALISIAVSISACSSAMKNQCEKENWYEYGKKLGSQGANVSNDPYFGQCRSEDISPDMNQVNSGYAQGLGVHCSPAKFLELGKQGDVASFDICPADRVPGLRKQYDTGIKKHCTKKGAFERGISGKELVHVCSESQQSTHQKFYLQGRKKFFVNQIAKKELEPMLIDQKIAALDLEISKADKELVERLATEKDLAENPKKLGNQVFDSVLGGDSSGTIQNRIQKLKDEKKALMDRKPEIQKEIVNLRAKLLEVESQEMPEDRDLESKPEGSLSEAPKPTAAPTATPVVAPTFAPSPTAEPASGV